MFYKKNLSFDVKLVYGRWSVYERTATSNYLINKILGFFFVKDVSMSCKTNCVFNRI